MNVKHTLAAFVLSAGLGLVACGGSEPTVPAADPSSGSEPVAAVEEPAAAQAEAYGYAHVDWEGWGIDLGKASVEWDEGLGIDIVYIPVKATNNTGDAAEFANYENFMLYDEDDEYLDPSWDYAEIDAESDETPDGASIELLFAYETWGSYGDMRFAIRGYSESADDTEVAYTIAESAESLAAAGAEAADLAAKKDASEAEMVGAEVIKPEDWYFETVENKKIELDREDGEEGYVTLAFATVDDDPYDRAVSYAGNFGLGEADVMSATVNGVEWFYYLPTDTQFEAYGQATDGVVNASGMFVSWDDAQPVLEGVTLI